MNKDPAEYQVGGTHYTDLEIQPWEVMEAWMTEEQFAGFLLGCVLKRLARYNAKVAGKGGLVDLLKAQHELDRLVIHCKAHPDAPPPPGL